jgi:signal transduction histidine kinase/CheY-like chemotaxis protein
MTNPAEVIQTIINGGIYLHLILGGLFLLIIVFAVALLNTKSAYRRIRESAFQENSKLKKENSIYKKKLTTTNQQLIAASDKYKEYYSLSKTSAKQLDDYLGNILGQLWVFSYNGILTYCSEFSFLGVSLLPENACGNHISELLDERSHELIQIITESLQSGDKKEDFPFSVNAQGLHQTYLLNIQPIYGDNDILESVSVHIQDYSLGAEVKNISTAIMQNCSEAIIFYQKDTILFANSKLAQLTGYSMHELKDLSFSSIVNYSVFRESQYDDTTNLFIPQGTYLQQKDGAKTPVFIFQKPIYYNKREANLLMITSEEMLAKKSNDEDDAKYSPFVFDSMLNNLHEGILLTDAENKILHVNDDFLENIDGDRKRATGRSVFDVANDVSKKLIDEDVYLKILNSIRNREEQLSLEVRLINKKIVELDLIFYYDDMKKYAGMIMKTVDITSKVKAVEKLQDEIHDAQESNTSKALFLANMSHEIRTPMNGIAGVANLMGKTDLTEQQKRYMSIIKASSDSLLDIINDILDFSKIEAGYLKLENIEFKIADVITNVTDILTMKSEKKHVELITCIDPEIPNNVIGDPTRFRQILINLGNNAVKFTEKGQISFNVKLERVSGKEITLKIDVTDTGIGIKPDKIDEIFNSFSQEDDSTTRKYGGTGLGLSISQKLVKMMGGDIWVESEYGHGTTFHFNIKLQNAESESMANIKHIFTQYNLRTAIAARNDIAAKSINDTLKFYGFNAVTIKDVNELEDTLLNSARSGQPFDLLLIDLFDGDISFEALIQILRLYPELEKLAIIPMVDIKTAANFNSQRNLEVDSYVNKPIKTSELLRVIADVKDIQEFKNVEINFDDVKNEISNEVNKLKIILAEDNMINQGIIKEVLESEGHIVACANNGQEVFDIIDESYDLILMDVQMPVMDGLTATVKIRETSSDLSKIPIIALTADVFQEHKERCVEAGMDGFLSKPIQIKELNSILAKISNGEKIEPQADQDDSDIGGTEINMQHIYDTLGDNPKIVLKTFELIIKKFPLTMRDIRTAISNKDSASIKRGAHGIKGFVNYFDIPDLKQNVIDLERAGKEEDIKKAKLIMIDLDDIVNEFLKGLRRKISELTN